METRQGEALGKVEQESSQKINTNNKGKAYFFIIAIAALLATNIYFYIKFKSSGEKLYTVTLQRENLQGEIDRIEAELDNIKNQGVEMTTDFQATEDSARKAIDDLRIHLEKSDLDEDQLNIAKKQVAALKNNVSTFKEEVISLRVKNELLTKENEKLDRQLENRNGQLTALEEQKSVLHEKVTKASSIKVSNVHINGIQVKRNGSMDVDMRARRVDKLQINFTISDNPIALIGTKEVFVRIINPNGNLIANTGDIFYVHGEKLQYTFKQNINFTNNGEEYQFLWEDPQGFKNGAYTILLYADNAIMGRSSIVLK